MAALVEQRVGRYRIDVVIGKELVEIQLASLSAIRDKIAALVKRHDVRVVKPIIARKYSGEASEGGRQSPFRGGAVRSRGPCSMCLKSWSTSRGCFRIGG